MQTDIYSTVPQAIYVSQYIDQFIDIRPRLCILHKWPHYNGYGLHLTCNEHWRGLCINEVEANSPAASAGLLRGDVVFAINGHPITNDAFFIILSLVQRELAKDQLTLLVLDPSTAKLVQQYQVNISENDPNCIRIETNKSEHVSTYNVRNEECKIIGHEIYSKAELRMCSITLRPSNEPIGIYLRTDTEFSHIITYVRPNSSADRAGIQQDDCIISLNGTLLLNITFEDVLYFLAKSRKEAQLDFLVAQKTYLIQLSKEQLASKIHDEISKISDSVKRKRASTLPTREQIYQQHKYEQTKKFQQNEMLNADSNDRLSLQQYSSLMSGIRKKNHGKFLDTIGPITAFGSSWSLPSEKTITYSSIRADIYGQKSGFYDVPRYSAVKNAHNSPKTSIVIPSPSLPSPQIVVQPPSETERQSIQSLSPLLQRFMKLPKILPSPKLLMKNKQSNNTPSPILKRKLTLAKIFNRGSRSPSLATPSLSIREKATTSVSELPNYGYEIHQIHLMKPSELVPIGFKLSKKADSLQYTMTAIIDGSQADKAGLKINDWLLKIEDKDIRLIDLHDVLKEIYRLFIDQGSVNMIIGRKKLNEEDFQKQTPEEHQDQHHLLSCVGLSNPIASQNLHSPSHQKSLINQLTDLNTNKIRSITLKETTGLYIKSFMSNEDNQNQLHFVNNIQPISMAYRAGLRNSDRILTINDVDVTKSSPEDLQLLLTKQKPIHLTVVYDSEYLKTLENRTNEETRKTCTSAIYESLDYLQSKESNNILFTDEQGPIYIKHCIVRKGPTDEALGFLLNFEDNVHIARSVETDFPAYQNGVRDGDVILFVNKQSVQQMTHDDLKSFIRTLISSQTAIDLILLNQNDLQRYKTYHSKRFIDWFHVFSKIYKNLPNQTNSNNTDHSYVNESSKPTTDDLSPGSVLNGARICVVEIIPDHSMGFTIEGGCPAPFRICKVEIDSPADKAGLQVNDFFISINGTSVLDKTYDNVLQIIRQATQQSHVQFVVNKLIKKKSSDSDQESDASLSYSSDEEYNKVRQRENTSHQSANAVQLYQKQRAKELSYVVRHCHITATNNDGTQAPSFGFELTEDSLYQYPIVSRVESKSPGERCGLQNNDILLKVNDRKTKGVNFDKVKKILDKAKHDGRVEMLVVDKDAFDYCIKTNRKFKEPYIKVKHIFPRSRSSINYQSLPLIATKNYSLSMESERFTFKSNLDSPVSPDKNELKSDNCMHRNDSLPILSTKNTIAEDPYEKENDESIVDSVFSTINNFIGNIKSDKSSSNLTYDVPPERSNSSQVSTPVLSTFAPISNQSKSNDTNQLISQYDVIKEPRQCVLQLDPNRGLGFLLSSMGDYGHTITGIDKDSIADVAGLQINDEIVEIDGVNVRNTNYEQVVDMLITAMQTKDSIEIHVINIQNSFNLDDNINNNNNTRNSVSSTPILDDDTRDRKKQKNSLTRLTFNTSQPNLQNISIYRDNSTNYNRSESVPGYSTGITTSPFSLRSRPIITTSENQSNDHESVIISIKDAPVARLCRIQKFPSSPFYGFFLCGDRKMPGRVFVSDIKKNSSAFICGLRDGDNIIEVNGTNIQNLTYETILNIIKMHMDHQDLELLVLDKKALRWYQKRNYPVSSQTLPTIVHIEPIINS